MSAPTTVQWLRTAVHRIAIGSSRRATYLTAWTLHRVRRVWDGARGWLDEGAGFGWWLRAGLLLAAVVILRKIATALGIGIYHRIADGGAPVLCWGAAAWWTVSAYRAGADGWQPKRPAAPPDQPPAETASEQPPPGDEAPPRPPVARVIAVAELNAAVRAIGTPHAQLVPLAEHLGTSTEQVRSTAARAGWEVKDVRMQGRSSAAGLRGDALPPLASATPSRDVVGAGERADDNDDDIPSGEFRKGLRVEAIGQAGTVVRHPADAVRHHQVRDH